MIKSTNYKRLAIGLFLLTGTISTFGNYDIMKLINYKGQSMSHRGNIIIRNFFTLICSLFQCS
jgi:hypothetical protein